jgi:predicted amino acid dehydrogenase
MQAVASEGRTIPSHTSADRIRLRCGCRRERHRAADAAIDYAFLIHPTEVEDLVLNDPTFARFTPQEFLAYQAYSAQLPPGIVCEIPEMVSLTGARARGALIGLSLLPEQMIARGRADVCKAIASAVDLAHRRGARLVGLGAFTSIYTRKGVAVVGRGPSITTGNLLTAGMTFNALQWILKRRQMSMANCRVGIVGARGSVGALVAQLVAGRGHAEWFWSTIRERHRRARPGRGAFAVSAAQPQRRPGTPALLEHCNLIISASSSPTRSRRYAYSGNHHLRRGAPI